MALARPRKAPRSADETARLVALPLRRAPLRHRGSRAVRCRRRRDRGRLREASEHLPAALRTALADEGSNTFTADMLDPVVRDLTDLEGLAPEADFLVFYEPPTLDSRIENQFAAFSFMSSAEARMDEWLSRHPDVWRGS